MTDWTPARVEERLRKAIALKARLLQPDQVPSPGEHALLMSPPGGEGIGTTGGIGPDYSGDDVVRTATDALSWLRWLNAADAEIVVARLEGARWKMICWRYGISRPTADRRWRYALALIAWRLNGPTSSSTPSLRSVLKRHPSRPGCETFIEETGSKRFG